MPVLSSIQKMSEWPEKNKKRGKIKKLEKEKELQPPIIADIWQFQITNYLLLENKKFSGANLNFAMKLRFFSNGFAEIV